MLDNGGAEATYPKVATRQSSPPKSPTIHQWPRVLCARHTPRTSTRYLPRSQFLKKRRRSCQDQKSFSGRTSKHIMAPLPQIRLKNLCANNGRFGGTFPRNSRKRIAQARAVLMFVYVPGHESGSP